MLCFHPVRIRDPAFANDPKYSQLPLDQCPTILVPCCKCFACQSNRRKEWFMRIKTEMSHSLLSWTVTLTYDNDHLPALQRYVPCDPLSPDFREDSVFWYHPYDYDHVQRFFKRLRKKYEFRYFGVAEFGGKRGRPHYHIIFFFNKPYDKLRFSSDVFNNWFYGVEITIDDTNDDCIGYTLKYCLKPFTSTDPSPKVFMSKKPCIGYQFMSDRMLDYLYTHPGDVHNTVVGRMRLPRLFRNKIYDDDMKETNKFIIQDMLHKKYFDDCRFADSLGISYDELLLRRRQNFITRCWKQIKKKSL